MRSPGDPNGKLLPMAFSKAPQPPTDEIRADAERSDEIDEYIEGEIKEDEPGLALAVIATGAVVHAAGYGLADVNGGRAVAPNTIFHLASCGKQLTGLGILMLAEEGRIGLDDPVGRHIPSLTGFGPKLTLRELLHHTSCIRDLYDDDGVDEVLARNENPTNADVIRTYADLGCPMAKARLKPGDAFNYSNSGYELLGAVIEQVSGQSYHDFFARRVFEPLGMKDTFSVPDRRVRDPRCAIGYALDKRKELIEAGGSEFDRLVGSGSFYTTVLDLCLYDRALRTNSLVGEASLEEAFTSGQTNNGEPTNYGFGWFLGEQDGITFADHEGEWNGFRSYICFCLDRPLSLFLLSNHPDLDLVEIANVATDAYA
jgi:CubicO group peptidase (beta-lactamase class C family)